MTRGAIRRFDGHAMPTQIASEMQLCQHIGMNDAERPREQISELRQNIVALSKRLKQSARADSETWTRLMTLGAIERLAGRATPTMIASELDLRSSNLARILNELDGRDLIQRTPDPTDKRKVRLLLTEAGLALVGETRARRDRWLSDAMEICLSPEEQAHLIAASDLIRRLATSSQSRP